MNGTPPLSRLRISLIVASVAFFLPPLALGFQMIGEDGFCGTCCPRMFFLWRAGQSWQNFLAGFLRAHWGVVLLASIFVCTLFWGRYWCSHVCPIGGVTELISRLIPDFWKIDFSRLPAAGFRYGYLAVYIMAPACGIGSLCCNYCNFGTVPRLIAAPFSSADMAYFFRVTGQISLGTVLVLGFLSKGGRAYCNLLCPLGALDALCNSLGAKLGRTRMRIDHTKCSKCGFCRRACPTWAIENVGGRFVIDQLSCISCGTCKIVCRREGVVRE